MSMDLDLQDEDERANISAADAEVRPSTFRRAWKRLRSAFTPHRANKVTKRTSRQAAGQVQGNRDFQTPSPSPQPPHTTCGPTNLSHSQDKATPSRECVQKEKETQSPTPGQSLPLTSIPDRPRLQQLAASEGNLISCPTKHSISDRSRPISGASTISCYSAPRPRTSPAFANAHQVRLPSRKDRVASLFGKYGLSVEEDGHFSQDPHAEQAQSALRVHKVAKVRVHYHCHKCTMAIGSNGICIHCGHRRCRDCTRWPFKRPDSASRSSKENRRSLPPLASSSTRSETLDVWLSTPRPGTQYSSRPLSGLFSHTNVFLTRKIRRLCHRCHSPFIWTETRCQDCNHTLCNACPREPSQTSSESPGPGSASPTQPTARIRERVLKKPRIRVRYNCDHCLSLFEEGSKKCPECGHQRCETCVRWPPRSQPSREPDAAAMEAFRRRMESIP